MGFLKISLGFYNIYIFMYMICRKCKIDKEQHLMVNHPKDKICKECQKQYQKNKSKDYYQKNKIKILTNIKEKRNNDPITKQKFKKYKQKYNQDNRDKIKQQKINNKEKYKIKQKEYYINNRDKIINKTKKYNKQKYLSDPYYRLSSLLRCRLNEMIKSQYIIKTSSSIKLLGCTIEQCKQHLESQFKLGMTWNNQGSIWEVDHIKPCSLFDLTDIEQQKQCFHYTNLQPLFKTTEIAESFGYSNEIGNRDKSDNIYYYN